LIDVSPGQAGRTVVGILADTHLPHREKELPAEILHIFQGADLILHAGDVDDSRFLEPLRSLAPVYAVRGNIHFFDLSSGGRDLPEHIFLTIRGWRLVLTHGHHPGLPGLFTKALDFTRFRIIGASKKEINQSYAPRLRRRYPQADIIVFGHTHHPYRAWLDGAFFFNPGAVCLTRKEVPSVGRLVLTETEIEAEIITLSR
jgi:putative phosphoesterase